MIHVLMLLYGPVFIYQNPHVIPIIVVSVVVINQQRPLVYINVLCMSALFFTASICLPEVSYSSNVLAFSNSLVTRTREMCMKIYTFISSLVIRETAHLKACVLPKSSLFMKDSTLVLSRGTNDSVTVVTR